MQRNDVIRATCESLGADMEGITHVDGECVFVKGFLPDETADIRILKTEKRYAFAKVEKLVEANEAIRCENDCSSYPRCGGCTCRHMVYSQTLENKRTQVKECLKRIGGIEADVPPVIGMEKPFHYRNKTAMPVGGTAENPVIGFYAPRSHDIIPVTSCPNAMEPADKLADALKAYIREAHVLPYDEKSGKGLIRHLMVRVSREGGVMVILVATGKQLPKEELLCEKLKAAGATSVIINVNKEKTNVILGREYRTVFGEDTMEDLLCGFRFSVSPASFFQVNPAQTEKLYQTALDFAQLQPGDRVCDVYCGAGTISLMLSQKAKEVIGIEIVPAAIENAKQNAIRNKVTNTQFFCGAAEDVLPDMVEKGLRPDVIVIDPPRKGAEEAVLLAMAKAAPRRIVYVSCNVATQARDAKILCENGYRVEQVQSVDMFCYTSGVENVMAFVKE